MIAFHLCAEKTQLSDSHPGLGRMDKLPLYVFRAVRVNEMSWFGDEIKVVVLIDEILGCVAFRLEIPAVQTVQNLIQSLLRNRGRCVY